MSGIVGIINLDGAPVNRELLERMTAFMAFRGPDARRTWVDDHVGLGHTLLATTFEAKNEQQPHSLDNNVWIVADARIDGRSELMQKLRGKGRDIHKTTTDPELILHAYAIWDEQCLSHLIGDFAFAIWDGRKKRLFCARDHFGIKPFYYAKVGGHLIFSNTLNCIRQHPGVSSELNDLAIADFLMFGFNQELDTTSFRDIRRLSPAHQLICDKEDVRTHRYWTLPTSGRIRYRKDQDYIEHFKELFNIVVNDRLRTDSVSIWMSGGLDSTSIAATVQNLPSPYKKPAHVHAKTIVYDHLLPDSDRQFSEVIAQELGMQYDRLAADDYQLYERWDESETTSPEPMDEPLYIIGKDFQRMTATHSRVVLNGQGGDEVLYRECVVNLIGRMPLLELMGSVISALFVYHRRPAFCIRSQLHQWFGKEGNGIEGFPGWLNKDFTREYDLKTRYSHYLSQQLSSHVTDSRHSLRPSAIKRLSAKLWPIYLEAHDPGITGMPLEVRWPFLDTRLVSNLLAFPPIPWCIDKTLLRGAMQGSLPEPVLSRPKTPLTGDPIIENLKNERYRWIDNFKPAPGLGDYVIRDAIPKIVKQQITPEDPWGQMRPLNLNFWLNKYAL